jgi:hypothetical protein
LFSAYAGTLGSVLIECIDRARTIDAVSGVAMTTWTSDELRTIETAEELELASLQRDGPVMEGPHRLLVPRRQVRHAGHIQVGSVDKDVTFVAEAGSARRARRGQSASCRQVQGEWQTRPASLTFAGSRHSSVEDRRRT